MYIHLINDDDDWDEERIDIIGQNGNDGIHYERSDDGQTLQQTIPTKIEQEKERGETK